MANRLRLHARPNAPVTNQEEDLSHWNGDLFAVPLFR